MSSKANKRSVNISGIKTEQEHNVGYVCGLTGISAPRRSCAPIRESDERKVDHKEASPRPHLVYLFSTCHEEKFIEKECTTRCFCKSTSAEQTENGSRLALLGPSPTALHSFEKCAVFYNSELRALQCNTYCAAIMIFGELQHKYIQQFRKVS